MPIITSLNTDAKNEFAMKLLTVFNDEYLSHQHGCAEAELLVGDDGEAIYNKKGEVIFIDCDENKMTASDLIEWFNITMFDPELQDEVTLKMRAWHGRAIDRGYITDKTKTSW